MAIRLGAHISSVGGAGKAAERAGAIGCQALQIFTASPRQWRARPVEAKAAAEWRRRMPEAKLAPLVVHANYLINLASANRKFEAMSRQAFRGELERAAAIGAQYLVLHPGSGEMERAVEGIRAASEGFAWNGLRLLIENMAGGGSHLGGDFGKVAAMLEALEGLPVGACIDTCHAWAAGYDLATARGYAAAIRELEATVGLERVPVFHANDAKTARGSHHDRHEHIGKGQLGMATFRRLLRDRRLGGKTFLIETPVDAPDAQAKDLAALREAMRPATRKR